MDCTYRWFVRGCCNLRTGWNQSPRWLRRRRGRWCRASVRQLRVAHRHGAYDPAIGMFLQRDPIGFSSGDLNLYAYVENNPFNWSDPSGLEAAGYATTTAGSVAIASSLFGALTRFINLMNLAILLENSTTKPDNPPDNPPVPDTADCDPAKNPKRV